MELVNYQRVSCSANFWVCLSCLPSASVLHSFKSGHGWYSAVTELNYVHRGIHYIRDADSACSCLCACVLIPDVSMNLINS